MRIYTHSNTPAPSPLPFFSSKHLAFLPKGVMRAGVSNSARRCRTVSRRSVRYKFETAQVSRRRRSTEYFFPRDEGQRLENMQYISRVRGPLHSPMPSLFPEICSERTCRRCGRSEVRRTGTVCHRFQKVEFRKKKKKRLCVVT